MTINMLQSHILQMSHHLNILKDTALKSNKTFAITCVCFFVIQLMLQILTPCNRISTMWSTFKATLKLSLLQSRTFTLKFTPTHLSFINKKLSKGLGILLSLTIFITLCPYPSMCPPFILSAAHKYSWHKRLCSVLTAFATNYNKWLQEEEK